MAIMRSSWFFFLVLTLVMLHASARDIPKSKSIDTQKKTQEANYNNAKDITKKTTNTLVNNNNPSEPSKDVPKGDEVNNDDKHFISFGGVGAAGGVGGVAGIIPIDFLDKGLGGGILPGGGFGGLGGGAGGGGLGGGGVGGGGGGGCPTSTSGGGLVPKP